MPVLVRISDNVRIVEPAGALTVGPGSLAKPLDLRGERVADLDDTLDALMKQGHTSILLNLHRVNFIDSAGLGELITWKNSAVERSVDLKLLRPTERVRRLLDLTRLTQFFEVYYDEEEALSSF